MQSIKTEAPSGMTNPFSEYLKANFFSPSFFVSFPFSLVAGWKLSPMVGAMYGPELYAGEALGMCCPITH